jgi:hypothetical protein
MITEKAFDAAVSVEKSRGEKNEASDLSDISSTGEEAYD